MQDVTEAVKADLEERANYGEKKYGGRLTPYSRYNQTTPIRNAYEEALDLACYLKQKLMEEELSETPPVEPPF